MKVSVIIPVYNGEDSLPRAIDSVLGQKTKYSYEIIIVNDCSTDNTQNIIEEYSKKYENVIGIVNENNIGVNESRNKAIHQSKGEFIAFLDADDSWYENKIEKQVNVLSKNKDISLCFSDFSIFDHNDKFICNNFQYWKYFKKMIKPQQDFQICKNIFSVVIKENIIGTSCVMVRKSELMKTDLFKSDLAYSQDWDLWLKLAVGNSFAFINSPLMKYYMMPNSITRKKRVKTHLISIVKKYKENCKPHTYSIAKSNCYAFIGESAFAAQEKKEAIKFYFKSFKAHFQLNNLKKFVWHLVH